MQFAQRWLLTIFLMACTFGLGVWYGQSRLSVQEHASVPEQVTPTRAPSASPPEPASLADFLAIQRWYQATQWLQQPDQQITTQHGDLLIEAIRTHMNKYDALAMRRMLNLYLQQQPGDARALFLLADLQILEGLNETALQTLLGVMSGGFSMDDIATARREADRLIETITTSLRNRGAFSDLHQFWQVVSESYPTSDAYRYRWARSLYLAGELDQARRLLLEIGTTDVSQASLDELAAEIEQARTGPGFAQRNGQLVATVTNSVDTAEGFELLVDTGANITSLSRRALRQLGASPTGRNVQVRTAGGTVETEVFFVPQMYVQGRLVTNLRTLRLPNEMMGLDGLLGTDVLRRLNWMPVDSL